MKLIDWLLRKKTQIVANAIKKKPSDFKKGEVYKMAVAGESHVRSPYYVLISEVGELFIVTSIPLEHSLKIPYPSSGWNYHIPRMKLIGNETKHKVLLYNQKNLI